MRFVIALFLAITLTTLNSYASCSGKINSFNLGPNNEILANIHFEYNSKSEDMNKTYFPEDVLNLTDEEFVNKLSDDIADFCSVLIKAEYAQAKQYPEFEARKKLSNDMLTRINGFIDKINAIAVSKQSDDVLIDSDGDKMYDQRWTIKDDGTKTITSIDPVPIGK